MTALAWNPPRVDQPWRLPFAITACLVALVLLAYHDTATVMVGIWMRSETYTHAFVVPPIVAWLIWRKRAELARLQPRPMAWTLLAMVGLSGLWWLGSLVNVAAATQLAMTAAVVATVPLVLGWQVTRVLAFPLAFTFFAVPIGEFMTPTLMYWTAEALVAGLRLTGIPVYQEGQQLIIPSGRWAVIEACGGIRYLMATFMVGSLFAYLNYRSTRRRLVFVAVTLVLPVLANWVRAYIIVMLGHLSNNQIAVGADHLLYGWVFFGIVIMALFFVGARWAEYDLPDTPVRGVSGQSSSMVPAWQAVVVALTAWLIVQWPVWVQSRVDTPVATAPVQLELPVALGSWQGETIASDDWTPAFVMASARQSRVYQGPSGPVTVHVSYYRGQTGEVKLVSSANKLVEDKFHLWNVLAQRQAVAEVAGKPVTWRAATILGGEEDQRPGVTRPHLTVWQLYWIGGRLVQNDIQAKLLQAWLAVSGEPDDGAAIHLVSMLPDDAAAHRQLSSFVAENFTLLQASLIQARQIR